MNIEDRIDTRLASLESKLSTSDYRIDSLEKTAANHSEQYMGLRMELTRVDESVRGMREQARVHSEAQTKALSEMHAAIKSEMTRLETFIQKVAEEQQKIMDKIISALGIDDDIHAAHNLRKDLESLRKNNDTKNNDLRAIRNWVIAALLGGLGFIVVLGIYKFVE